ncbi:glycerate kinase [Pseudonocardia sulfidoxydans NBRC 16205]|uniref:Glycerate kinase n=1 Tax=Pseudonocardia sulfidoxydans NBRC 16205 TaxID=1223511 RepID=A0A511DHI7_9PSEU|nr:glycerate kinase [Pseudonocardia sulfidoxydans]GEL24249.1 glycerate kinase [Pseudonocardia sulfidoxydans NBRC 16205]
MTRVLVAPDKFKGTLSASEVADAVATGLGEHGVETVRMPLADGGDGSVDAAVAAGFTRVGPAAYAGATGVVEVANTCGVVLVGTGDPMGASSVPFGQTVAETARNGRRRIVLALGGSASTDGGAGLLAACGYSFLDAHGHELEPCGATLERITRIRRPDRDLMDGIDLLIAGDVENPLLGAHGAARDFAPQKGASPAQVERLEVGLANLVAVLERDVRPDATSLAGLPGSGAAGGLGFAARVLGAEMTSGAAFFLDLLGFDTAVADCAAVVTGEGRLDVQTLGGKLPAVVIRRAAGRPVHLVVGRDDLGLEGAQRLGAASVSAVVDRTTCDPADDPGLSRWLLRRIGHDLASRVGTPAFRG